MKGGNHLPFRDGSGIHSEAFEQARKAAGSRDVRALEVWPPVRQFLEARLIDDAAPPRASHPHGARRELFARLDLAGLGYEVARSVAVNGPPTSLSEEAAGARA